MDPRIGFIGLGIMGTPMAGHLAAAGYPLTVYDLDRSSAERLATAHPDVAVGTDPATVGRDADVLITMLPTASRFNGWRWDRTGWPRRWPLGRW